MVHKNSVFIICTLIIHCIALAAGFLFFGPEYTIILAALWTIAWLGYCTYQQRHNEELYNASVYLKLALIGGPICWLFCPWAIWPSMHTKNTEPVTWIILIKLYNALATSLLKMMSLLFDLAQEERDTSSGEE